MARVGKPLILCGILLFGVDCLAEQENETPFDVVNVTPIGDGVSTTLGRITIEFNKPLMAFGRQFHEFSEIPVEVSPDVSCAWRAFSTNELTCLLNDDLEPETTYTIKVLDSAESLDGSALANGREFSFTTALLSVSQDWTSWKSPTIPVFRLYFSRPVTMSMVQQTVQILSLDGFENISVRATHSPSLNSLVGKFYRRDSDGQWKLMSDDDVVDFAIALAKGGTTINDAYHPAEVAGTNWYVEPATDLQSGSLYSLRLREGAKSIFGTESTENAVEFWSFKTFPKFELIGLECTDTKDDKEQYLVGVSERKALLLGDCNPDKEVTLLFNSPVGRVSTKTIPDISPQPTPGRYYPSEDRNNSPVRERTFKYSESASGQPDDRSDGFFTYTLPFEFHGKIEYSITAGTDPIADVFGRALTLPSPLAFQTGHMKPRIVSLDPVAIFELDSPLEIPIQFANLQHLQIGLKLDSLGEESRTKKDAFVDFEGLVNRPGRKTLDMRDWLDEETAQFVAEFEPIAYPDIGENPRKTCLYGQITPYNVNARVGMTSSVAWVTDLETGDVVRDAIVELVQLEENQRTTIFESKTDSDGIATAPGESELPGFPRIDSAYTGHYGLDSRFICASAYNAKYALKITGPKGVALLPLAQTFADSDGLTVLQEEPHLSVWGHTSQGIYSPGDDIQFKVYVRRQTGDGLRPIELDAKFLLVVLDEQGKLVHFRGEIEQSEFGTFDGEFQVPQSTLGTLRFLILFDNGESADEIQQMLPHLTKSQIGKPRGPYDSHWIAFSVDVLDFVPATIQLESRLDSDSYSNGDVVTVRGRAELLSGGPYSEAPVEALFEFLPKKFVPRSPQTNGFEFALAPDYMTSHVHGKTGPNGTFRLSRPVNIEKFFYGTMKVATGVQSDRGDVVWDYQHVNFRTADRFVGIRLDRKPIDAGSLVDVDVVVTDSTGEPKNDLPVTIEFAQSESADYGYRRNWKQVRTCRIEPDDDVKTCSFTPDIGGFYRATARIASENEWPQKIEREFWVRGKSPPSPLREWTYLRFVDGYAREREFTVGDTAALAIEHSIPNTKALVTVERLGVLDQWVVDLRGNGQFIDIPMKREYSPRVRVSIVAMVPGAANISRPRPNVAPGVLDTRAATQDASMFLTVTDPDPMLDITISTDRETYEPGEPVKVSVEAKRRDGSKLSAPLELAVAVVDQGVLEVSKAGLGHFDPIEGLSNTYEFAVQGFGLLSRGYGTIYWSMRMAPGASHSPKQDPRENTELVSQWIPNLRTNADGKASFEFEAGDRLTEWKIIVVAANSTDQFGYGHKSIRTRLDLEIHPILPNQVTDTDVFDASFYVLNRTDSERIVDVVLEVSGDVEPASTHESITLKSYQRKIVALPQSVLLNSDQTSGAVGSIELLAAATSGELSDAVVHTLPVHPNRRQAVHSIYGTSSERRVTEPVEFPPDIKNKSGRLDVVIASSVARSLGGKLQHIKDYPYLCWEQQLSKAAVAAHYAGLKQDVGFDWAERDEYVREVLASAVDFQASSGGFQYWPDSEDYSSPYLSAYTAQAFRWLSDAGHDVPEDLLSELLEYLEKHLKGTAANVQETTIPIASSLRMAIVNALVQHGRGDARLVESRYRDNENLDPFAVTQALHAALEVDAPKGLLDELAARLTNSIGVSGDKAMIQHDVARNGNVLHSSMLKTTCSAIAAFAKAHTAEQSLVPENKLAELVRGAVYEWNKPATRAVPHQSAYCFNAIIEYAASMEPEPGELDVSVNVAFGDKEHHIPAVQSEAAISKPGIVAFSTALEPSHLGREGKLVLNQDGGSRIYYAATLQYEPSNASQDAEHHGIDISKSYWLKTRDAWREIDSSTELNRGDLVRVSLRVDVRDSLDFVIVDDPVPGALEPIDPRLATTNIGEVVGEFWFYDVLHDATSDLWSTWGFLRRGFYRRELRHDSVKFVSDFLSSGTHRMQWTGRVISTGDFLARPAHAESMYAPEIYGKSTAQRLQVTRD